MSKFGWQHATVATVCWRALCDSGSTSGGLTTHRQHTVATEGFVTAVALRAWRKRTAVEELLSRNVQLRSTLMAGPGCVQVMIMWVGGPGLSP